MRFGSLFAGIGGLDLGLERAGMQCVWQVEIDDYCRRVLAKHWPDVRRHDDVKTFPPDGDWTCDLICGGFPCQPVSTAGKWLGTKDPRWLWPEFARVVRVLRPRYMLIENTPGLFVRGFDDVLGDLAALGFDAEWEVIPAAAFGSPHVRERLFVVAHAASERTGRVPAGRRAEGQGTIHSGRIGANGSAAADIDCERRGQGRQRNGRRQGRQSESAGNHRQAADAADAGAGRRPRCAATTPQSPDAHSARLPAPEQSGRQEPKEAAGVLRGSIAECDWWAAEPNVVRMVHGLRGRVDRVRALGNAVVPQVAEWIGRRIMIAAGAA